MSIRDGVFRIRDGASNEPNDGLLPAPDAAQTPMRIDLKRKTTKDTVIEGIYQTKETDKGLELTIAFVRSGSTDERPEDFKGAGEGTVVLKLLREK